MPSGTYTNVLRVHNIAVETDSDVSSLPFLVEDYVWYTAGFHLPLLEISIDTFESGKRIDDITYWRSIPTIVANGPKASADLQVYPNPATDIVNIQFNIADNSPVVITIADLTGRTVGQVNTGNVHIGNNEVNYSVAALPSGMYMLRLQSRQGTSIQKIVVSR